MKAHPEIILALDVADLKREKYFLEKLYPRVKIFKIGLQLFSSFGPKAVTLVQRKGGEVFLDLKLFDIPNTVANAVRAAVRLRVKMITLHICGGKEMLIAAAKAAQEEARLRGLRRPLLIGVTVLTSKNASPKQVLALARVALECGLDGVVCSVREAKFLRRKLNKKFLIVTPGIRPNNVAVDDQKRVATVKEAIQAGSDFLVVGRPILAAKDPLKAAKELFAN
jgi:orotidine-5'-phosphate decarboxylase